MVGLSRHVLSLTVLTVSLSLLCAESIPPVLHRVGRGKGTWEPNVNFTEWANREKFYVGDWLYFGFNKTVYNVLEVNQTGYEKCNDKNFLTNITRGGRDVFNLTEAKSYYFICSRGGYCSKGMKLFVHVEVGSPTTPCNKLPVGVYSDVAPRNINVALSCLLLALLSMNYI